MSSPTFYFGGSTPIVRIVVVGVAMYVALITFLRLSGSRTLSDMNAFDFIVTVAIGSVFGRALTARRVALAEALAAFALLIALQYIVTWVQVRWPGVQRGVTNPPALVYFQDDFVEGELRSERVTKSEIHAAVRKKGFADTSEVDAVVLESSGEFSVIESADRVPTLGERFDDLPPERQ
ncbi:YetF domain-containing protein [Halobacterium sp. R2-5]|uniref:DUF421 domain-containing protein n=1 Tax=Halobacterium sp. R2-5 TaxID=2715751 RepID=UPI001422A58A|nr:YetF domain-containing protein [Halobacterium sp. R2-5]NIB99566.1 DUF421 domain-containing protein [Halobacterium sp. R2-5]